MVLHHVSGEQRHMLFDLHCQSQTEESSQPEARTFPFGCHVSHYVIDQSVVPPSPSS